jgi:hypothetical protein
MLNTQGGAPLSSKTRYDGKSQSNSSLEMSA